jgi:hypothetical protein
MKPEYYSAPQAGDFAASNDPFALFESWFREAEAHEPNDPNAFALATVDAAGLPNVRVVLLKSVDAADRAARGFVFFTNFESAKGRELLGAKTAAMNFHWKSLRRQVRVRGAVTVVDAAEAEDYFSSRPRGSQVGAWRPNNPGRSRAGRPWRRLWPKWMPSIHGRCHGRPIGLVFACSRARSSSGMTGRSVCTSVSCFGVRKGSRGRSRCSIRDRQAGPIDRGKAAPAAGHG